MNLFTPETSMKIRKMNTQANYVKWRQDSTFFLANNETALHFNYIAPSLKTSNK